MKLISKIIGNQEKPVSNSGDSLGSSVTLNGNPLSFTKDTAGLASNTVITLEPIQAGTGDPSPSNVRAISGYDSVEIAIPRKNLLDKSMVVAGSISTSDGSEQSSTTIKRTGWTVVEPGETYTISSTSPSSNFRYFYYDSNKNFIASESGATPLSFSTGPSTKYVRFQAVNKVWDNDIQLELGWTATSYEPYNPATDLSIAMPGTVYGGTLDVESGELVVDKGIVDLGTLTWSTYRGNYYARHNNVLVGSSSQTSLVCCSMYKVVNNGTAAEHDSEDNVIFAALEDTSSTIYIRDTSVESASALATKVSGQKLTYKLATPITYHLTPHQVALLQGANVVTTNGTSIQLTHRQGEIAAQEDLVALAESVNGGSLSPSYALKGPGSFHITSSYQYDALFLVGQSGGNAIADIVPIHPLATIAHLTNQTGITITAEDSYNVAVTLPQYYGVTIVGNSGALTITKT